MVLKLVRNASRDAEDQLDLSSVSSDDRPLTDFQREMILAEKHAENVRKRQREDLLNSDAPLGGKSDSAFEMEEGLIIEDPYDTFSNGGTSTEGVAVDAGGSTLFEDEGDQVILAPAATVNRARVSKQRALHILDHPHCSKYLVGTIMRILVAVDSSPDSVGSVHPNLLYSHAVFKVERLVKVKPYPVYGCNFGNSCDHDIREFLGNAGYHFMGRIMTGQQSTPLCRVNLNDVCNASISQDEIKFGGEFLLRDLCQAASNLRSFTFTDADVQLMLERKLLKESVEPGAFQGNRSKLIVAIQRTSHEIELLTELVKNDPSKIDHLRELEARKAKMDEQLQTMKGPSRTPLFVKNCAVLRASDETTVRNGVMRKTTQPTPMIMFTPPDAHDGAGNDNNKHERRSISELNVEEQRDLITAYTKHMRECDPAKWRLTPTDVDMSIDDGMRAFPDIIRFSEYRQLH